MPPHSNLRIDGLTKSFAQRGQAKQRRREILEAEIAMGATIRRALPHAGIDLGCATRLVLADEAAAELAAMPAADGPLADLLLCDGDFAARIAALSRVFADGRPIDFANASFAELYAWALVQTGTG